MRFFPFSLFSRRRRPVENPPVPVPEGHAVPGTCLRAVTWPQPPMAPYALATGCYETDLHAALAVRLESAGAGGFVIIAADEQQVIVQTGTAVGRLHRASLRAVVLHPVLPAKGSGMVMLFFQIHPAGEEERLHEFFVARGYSKDLEVWCEKRARELARLLAVPMKVGEEGYDC